MDQPSAANIAIPKIFLSDSSGSYLDRCIGCDLNLLDLETDYLIEKAFKSYRGLDSYSTIFEYAMCLTCVHQMHQTLSIESRNNIDRYFIKQTASHHRNLPLDLRQDDLAPWIDRCLLTSAKATESPEFQIYGHCRGKTLIVDHYPFMISGKATDELVNLISNKTLDELQNFTDQLVGGPSEFADLLKTKPTILL